MLLVLGLRPVLAAGSYTFTPLAVPFPGANETIPSGINDLGTIVGTYEVLAAGTEHGFVLQEGVYTAFDPADSTFTVAGGINGRATLWERTIRAMVSFCRGVCLRTLTFLVPAYR